MLRKTFLKILEKLSLSEIPLERALSSYPTLVNKHLLQLLKDKDPAVRSSVHAVGRQLLLQSLPKNEKDSLTTEERSFLDHHVSNKEKEEDEDNISLG